MESRGGGTAGHRVLGTAKPGELLLKLSDFRTLGKERGFKDPDYRPDVRGIQTRPTVGYGAQTGWK